MDNALVAYGLILIWLAVLGALIVVKPRTAQPARDTSAQADLRVWDATVAECADLVAVTPLIVAAYLPSGVSR